MRKNRLTAFLMIIIMIISVLMVPAGAKAEETTVKDRNWRLYCTTDVFDRMNDDEKKLYNNLENVCMEFAKNSGIDADISENGLYYLDGAECENLSKEQAADVVKLFIYQNPQYYFTTMALGGRMEATPKGEIVKVYLSCIPDFANGKERAVITNNLFETIDKLVAEIQKDNTKKQDIERTAHDYLCDNLSYDDEVLDKLAKIGTPGQSSADLSDAACSQTIYSTFVKKSTVCAGYSLAMELLMNAAGVRSVVTFSDGHAWNKVNIDDGAWYSVDVTWADQKTWICYDFYNKSDATLSSIDGEQKMHEIKLPEYFPAAEKDFVSVAESTEIKDDSDKSDDNTSNETEEVKSDTKELDDSVSYGSTEISSTEVIVEADDSVKPESPESTSDVAQTQTVTDTVTELKVDVIEVEEDDTELTVSTTSISKVKALGGKKCKITWKKASDVDGYEIQLSTSQNFKKIAKKLKASQASTSATVKKLKKKGKYFVRIRTYKNVNGSQITSDWSGVKKVTIK